MSDSINGVGKPAGPPPRQPGNTPASGTATPTAGSTGAETVNLTDTARQLQALTRAVGTEETVDTNQVSAIRQALADGQYAVNSRQIAEQILQFDA